MSRNRNWSGPLLWAIYLSLLLVLLPHTAWGFARFEPAGRGWLGIPWGAFTAWSAAFAFEAAIAALTHKLANRIANAPQFSDDRAAWRRLSYQYGNAYAAGLFVAVAVSALANFGHAVEYGQTFVIFAQYNVSPLLYSLAFGGILPLVSLLFARILADTGEGEAGSNPVLEQANGTIKQLKVELRSTEAQAAEAETRATKAEQRFAAAGDVMARLFAEEKRPRILAAAERWPQLPAASIAIISGASPSYVSEVLKSRNGT
jgi:hypothetical protein